MEMNQRNLQMLFNLSLRKQEGAFVSDVLLKNIENDCDVICFEGFAVAKEYLNTDEKYHFIKYPKSENLTEEQKKIKEDELNEIKQKDRLVKVKRFVDDKIYSIANDMESFQMTIEHFCDR